MVDNIFIIDEYDLVLVLRFFLFFINLSFFFKKKKIGGRGKKSSNLVGKVKECDFSRTKGFDSYREKETLIVFGRRLVCTDTSCKFSLQIGALV